MQSPKLEETIDMAYDNMNADEWWTASWSQSDNFDAFSLFTDDIGRAQHTSGNVLGDTKTRWTQSMFTIPPPLLPSTHTASLPLLASSGVLDTTQDDFSQHAVASHVSTIRCPLGHCVAMANVPTLSENIQDVVAIPM